MKRPLMNGASGRGIAGARPALICFILGLLGALPLVALTPPFQVPDESQHFLRAYQLSELRMWGIVQDGEMKAMLPTTVTRSNCGLKMSNTERLRASVQVYACMRARAFIWRCAISNNRS